MPYKEYVLFCWDQILCWEDFIDSTMIYLVHIFPMAAGFCVVGFIDELDSFHTLGAVRYGDRGRELIKSAAVNSVVGGVTTVAPLMVLTVLVYYLMYPAMDSIGGIEELFPDGFYYRHAIVVYLVMMLIIYIPLMCAYSLMSFSVGLITRDRIKMILIPEAIYILLNYISIFTEGRSMTAGGDLLMCFNTPSSLTELFAELGLQLVLAFVVAITAFCIDGHRKLAV